jgi:phage tail-like protein
MSVARRSPDWLLDQLPVGMVQDDFFRRFVGIFQEIATSYVEGADGVEHVADPSVTPAPLLPWLGSWLGTSVIDASLDIDTQRRLVIASGHTMAWRGTRRGLTEWLHVLTGGPVLIDDPGGVHREGEAPQHPPVVRIRVISTGWLPEDEFITLVRAELPAHVGLELFVGDRMVASPPEPEPEPEPEAAGVPDRPLAADAAGAEALDEALDEATDEAPVTTDSTDSTDSPAGDDAEPPTEHPDA